MALFDSRPDPYRVLGVDRRAGRDEIENRYNMLADKYNLKQSARRAFDADAESEIREAYILLVDNNARVKYDEYVRLNAQRRAILAKLEEEYSKSPEQVSGEYQQQIRQDKNLVPEGEPCNVLLSIEHEIAERNRAYERLKRAGRSRSPRSSIRHEAKPAKRETLYVVPVDQLNLQVMNPQADRFLVDIVAVHGLGAVPEYTWADSKSGINWLSHPTMLPSIVTEARILRFGYDSLWMGKTPIRTSLSTIAYKLLLSLSRSRVEELQRPLILIGHCFGGLVIQCALNLAKMQQGAYPGVFDSSVGVVFLGTPHRGTRSFTENSALFAAIAASSELSQNLETGVLDSMRSDDGALLDVTDDFVSLCADGGPQITCFFEQRPSKIGKLVGRNDITEFIVDQRSATLDGHRKYGLELDHFSLNKFNGPDDPNYVQVSAEIYRFYLATKNHHSAPALPSRQGGEGVSGNARESDGKHAQSRCVVSGYEYDIKKNALNELRNEEATKQKLVYEREARQEHFESKRAIEQQSLERLRRNMAKYGIENPDEILRAYPLPDDRNLSSQEIKEKDKWHKNQIRGELSIVGLDGGQIDEILNDTGETMIIDEVETTYTKMAKKWISARTLDRYKIPWQNDKTDKSVIIIKRWVPDYEREFLWDHTQALRNHRGRRPHRDYERPTNLKSTPVARKAFAAQEKQMKQEASVLSALQLVGSLKEAITTRSKARHIEPEPVPSLHRASSHGSMHSAPDLYEVDRRRRDSRALSHSRERSPIGRQSSEFLRRESSEGGVASPSMARPSAHLSSREPPSPMEVETKPLR